MERFHVYMKFHYKLISLNRVIVNNSAKINKTENHIAPQIIEHKKDQDI